jgi:hypothetical protein
MPIVAMIAFVAGFSHRMSEQKEQFLKERTRIDAFMAFLGQRNRGWKFPRDTFPTREYTVTLEGEGIILLTLWISPGWIGGRDAN